MEVLDSIVIGGGQAGLSASHHLARLDLTHVVLDAAERPGGAWQHRWDSLTMHDVHGVAALPDFPAPPADEDARANTLVPAYFAAYEQEMGLPVVRGVRVEAVRDAPGDLLEVVAGEQRWLARTIVNATGTWDRPYVPYYPGRETFRGEQLHTVDYRGPEAFRGRRVLVVGGGASAVQLLGEIRPVTDTLWMTRRPPVWRHEPFDHEAGREAVRLVEERVRRGLPPRSVVGVTGLMLRPQEAAAARLGAYERHPMLERIEPDGVVVQGRLERVDVIVWATGFRPAVAHLAPLHLRSEHGGIQLDRTTAVLDPRVQLVGYGPSASTIGANRAGRFAALGVRRHLTQPRLGVPPARGGVAHDGGIAG